MAFGNRRADRVEAALLKAAAEILARGDLPVDLPTFITVNSCKMSDDLRNCTLYISAYTDDLDTLEATAAVLEEMIKTWQSGGSSARDIFLMEKLEKVMTVIS